MTKSENKKISIARGTAIVSSLTLLSRILGFLRDLLIARGFGSSVYADCFFVAFRIPNLLRSLVAEGAFSSAFVPVFADSVKRGGDNPQQTIRRISGFLLSLTVILSALGIIYAPEIVSAFAPGFQKNLQIVDLCIELTRYMLPMIICVSLVAMINGALNTLGDFGASAWAQVWMNLALIAGAFLAMFFDSADGVRILAYSALAGAVLQILVQFPALNRNKLSLKPGSSMRHAEVFLLLKLMLPAIIGATVYQFGIFLNTLLASLLTEGSVSWLYYADRLIQFPLGTFSIALGSVLLPALAISHSEGDSSGFASKTFASLSYTSLFMIPLAAFIYTYSAELTALLFERGSFSALDTQKTSQAVGMYVIGLWAVSSHSLLARTFIARKDTITTTVVGIASLLVNFIVSLLCVGPLSRDVKIISSIQHFLNGFLPSSALGHIGLAMASATASIFSFLVLAVLSTRYLKIGWRGYLLSTVKILLAALLAAALVNWMDLLSNEANLLKILANFLLGGLIYCICLNFFRVKEAKQVSMIIKKRCFR